MIAQIPTATVSRIRENSTKKTITSIRFASGFASRRP
jgi:hypothetical protein